MSDTATAPRDLLVPLRARIRSTRVRVLAFAQLACEMLVLVGDQDSVTLLDTAAALQHILDAREAEHVLSALVREYEALEELMVTAPHPDDVVSGWRWGRYTPSNWSRAPGESSIAYGWWKGDVLIWHKIDRWYHTCCGEDYEGGASAAEVMQHLDRSTT